VLGDSTFVGTTSHHSRPPATADPGPMNLT
jgi:hypothetical protein